MVTGEPGSGKTSLGLALSAALRVPFLSRDHVRGGLLATAGLWTDQMHDDRPRREAAVEAFAALVETAAQLGITLVAEFIVTPERQDAMRRLETATHVVVIETHATDASERARRRDQADPLVNRPDVLAALGHRTIDDYLAEPERNRIRTVMQRDFDLPLLHVTTDDGYDPPLDAIVDWLVDRTRR